MSGATTEDVLSGRARWSCVDQSWAKARDYAADFERIAMHGPQFGSARDHHLVRLAARLCALELGMREERWGEDGGEEYGILDRAG